jgi:protein-S-isoprenylcysteine O-methyltransferase Ste14
VKEKTSDATAAQQQRARATIHAPLSASAKDEFHDPVYDDDPRIVKSHPTWPLEQGQSALTGWVGALIIVGASLVAAFFRNIPLPMEWRYPLLLVAVFSGMALVEVVVFKVHRRNFDFSQTRPFTDAAFGRVMQRCTALYFCMALATFLYTYMGDYNFYLSPYPEGFFYYEFRLFFFGVLAVLFFGSPVYFWMVERYARPTPHDEFLNFSRFLTRLPRFFSVRTEEERIENAHAANLLRGLLVKFFYVPLMLKWGIMNWGNWEVRVHGLLDSFSGMKWHELTSFALNVHSIWLIIFQLIILVDLTTAVVGYIVSMRLLDTHVVSAEPTLLGWMVALFCYPPFVTGVTGIYLQWKGEDVWPEYVFAHIPVLAMIMGTISVSLMAIYAWATFSFGMRFSNLTNRGVVCCGPYKYVRHPAYICKNLSWWIQGIPEAAINLTANPHLAIAQIFHLILTSVLYGTRAWTEERHMMRERHYREYCKKVPWRFIPGVW